ncbi:MAG: hypothetical protein LBR33_10375 [Propionibacteriaceae bacterium]|nr:hypothetical protein [Propionibacteriaceae bacterium]
MAKYLAATAIVRELEAAKTAALADVIATHTWSDSPDTDDGPARLRAVTIAGQRFPEDLPLEIAAAEHISRGRADYLIRDILNLQTRHPLCWAKVLDAQAPLAQACRVAGDTTDAQLDDQAAHSVDRDIAPLLGKTAGPRFAHALRAAIMKADPNRARKIAGSVTPERFCRKFDTDDPLAGYVSARLDKADAIYLDATVQLIADHLEAHGDERGEDARRAAALGLMANPAKVIELIGHHTDRGLDHPDDPHPANSNLFRRPAVQLYAHVHVSNLDEDDAVATLEDLGPVFYDQIKDLVAGAPVRVTPVIHVGYDHQTVDAYETPDRIREHVLVRDRYEMFPYSSRPARGCDLDHTVEYRPGARNQTRPSNLGPLSRSVHRAKTHAHWQLSQPEPGVFRWQTPAGQTFQVDQYGTVAIGHATAGNHLNLWDIQRLKPHDDT